MSTKYSKFDKYNTEDKTAEAREEEWKEVERLVMLYKKQFEVNMSEEEIIESKDAGAKLIELFYPLVRKYTILLRTGHVDFSDKEQKSFVSTFMDDDDLKKALCRTKQSSSFRSRIYSKFNFVKETYGSLQEDEIKIDLQMLFLNLAKRYKQCGKSFCGYLYNTYKYEVMRHIQKFTENPLNISYKNIGYEDYMKTTTEKSIEDNCFEDNLYENNVGIPDFEWVRGSGCSDIFKCLTPIERKILIKYYMEDWNDRQIADDLKIHINTVNQKRRQATEKIANELGMEKVAVIRNRKSGKKAIMPI